MTMDVEKLLLTDTRHPDTPRFEDGRVRFMYGSGLGLTGEIDFYLEEGLDNYPERLLQAAAACIAEYHDLIKEKPF